MIAGILAALAVLFAGGAQVEGRYQAGQIWDYQTRPGDEGSLVAIRAVEAYGPEKVYHVTVVGVSTADGAGPDVLAHLPVSQETLDASVTGLSAYRPVLPDYLEGVALWREAEGGVFTITLAEIVGIVDQQVRSLPRPPG